MSHTWTGDREEVLHLMMCGFRMDWILEYVKMSHNYFKKTLVMNWKWSKSSGNLWERAPWRQKHKANYYFTLCLILNKPCMHIENFCLLYTNLNILLLMLCTFHFFFNIFCITLKLVYYYSYGNASCHNVKSEISLGPISSLHNQHYFSSPGPLL